MVSQVCEKFRNNRLFDHLELYVLFSDFQYGFWSSQSTADLLTVVFDRIARVFNKSGAAWAVALDISKAFDRVRYAGLLHNLISSFPSKGQQNIQLMLKFVKAPFLVQCFSYYTFVNFLMMLSVILLSMLMILFCTLSVIKHLICGSH